MIQLEEKTTKVRVLAIIPAYNEAGMIVRVAQGVLNHKLQPSIEIDALVIDDGSTDATAELCQRNGLPVLALHNNLGIGGAVQCGYRYAHERRYDIAFQFDGDGQHNLDDLGNLLAPILADQADFVIGSRFLNSSGYQSTYLRRVGIRWLSAMLRLMTGRRISDPTSGFRAANARVIARFSHHYPHDYPEPESVMHLLREGYRVVEIPSSMLARSHGHSSIKGFKNVYYMAKVSLALLITRWG